MVVVCGEEFELIGIDSLILYPLGWGMARSLDFGMMYGVEISLCRPCLQTYTPLQWTQMLQYIL